jgi:predicted lipoprotein with Yx(FWY)xxD motif
LHVPDLQGGNEVRQLLATGAAVFAAIAIAACGGGGKTSSGAASSGTVSVKQLSGVGSVLVDQSGKALYTPNLEASGKVVCDGSCTAFWKPLQAGGGKPTGAAKLGVIKRPDGTMQVTSNGKPLYTFSEDSPGKATGNGFSDDFGGHHFTWHVVSSGGHASSGGQTPKPASGGGYGGY